MSGIDSSIETLDGLRRRIRITIDAAMLAEQVDARLAQMTATANVKGFRAGKAPLRVMRQQFGAAVRRDIVNEMVNARYAEVMQSSGLRVAGEPVIDIEPARAGADAVATVTVEEQPDIELTGLDRIEVEKPDVDLDAAEAAGVARPDAERQAAELSRAWLKHQIVEKLLETHPIDVPGSLVDQEQSFVEFALTEAGASEKPDDAGPDWVRELATRRVRTGLLLAAAAHGYEEQVEQLTQQWMARQEAAGGQQTEVERMQAPTIAMEEAVIDVLLTRVNIRPERMTLDELKKKVDAID